MMNRYTADKRLRSDDAYSPDEQPDRRPERAVIAYTARCRQAFSGVPVIIGGIEASLRRAAHYDYWSDAVRRSVLLDSKADLLHYGSGERSIVEVAHRLAGGTPIAEIRDVPGTVFCRKTTLAVDGEIRLPSFDEVAADGEAFCQAERLLHRQVHSGEGHTLVQACGDRDVCILPPTAPLTTEEIDGVYELPYTRRPHPSYGQARIAAWETTRFSVVIHRGCYGGCSFCSLGCHQGPVIQSRSEESILGEIERIRDTVPGFSGMIADLGGPSANMYRTRCRRPADAPPCKRFSCLYPSICKLLDPDHAPLIRLYRKARELRGVKKVLIGSGIRFDLALQSPAYVRELVEHHVGGYLKIAPEHICPGPLAHMQKPGLDVYERFKALFEKLSREVGKEQYLIPYLIAAHPGTSDDDMVEMALWLKRNQTHVDQVQTFIPSPMTFATAMYLTGRNPLTPGFEKVPFVPRDLPTRRLYKALLRYHDANNWPLLRRALKAMGREDLIGNGKSHLVPTWQPPGTGDRPEGARKAGKSAPRNDDRKSRPPRNNPGRRQH
jgi:uncharacterized radical SAM protein YgiQ